MSDAMSYDDSAFVPSHIESAIQSVLLMPLPNDAIERVKSRAKRLANDHYIVQPRKAARKALLGRVFGNTIFSKAAAAVVLIVFATLATVIFNSAASVAFGDVIAKIQKARNVQFRTLVGFGSGMEHEGKMFLEGNSLRLEQFDRRVVEIVDVKSKRAICLNMHDKTAQPLDISDKFKKDDKKPTALELNPLEQVLAAKSKDAKLIGQELIKGRRTNIYRISRVNLLRIKGKLDMLVWVDVESELPSKITIRSNDPKSFMEFQFDQFVWNEPLDAQLFSLDIPTGYTSGSVVTRPLPARDKVAGKEKPRLVNGVVQHRVPSDLAWNADGTRITALFRIPEADQGRMGVPNELMQWDRESGECLWSRKIEGANGMTGSPDGKLLAVVDQFEIQIRDSKNGKIIRKFVTKKHVTEMAFSPDGKTLAAGISEWPQKAILGILGQKGEGGVEIWNVEQGTLVQTIIDGEEPVGFVACLADGKHVATSSGRSIKVWNVATGKIHRIFPGNDCTAFSPDGELVACAHRVNKGEKSLAKVDIYRVADASFVRSLNYDAEQSSIWLTRLAFSADSKSVAAADWDSTVTVWDITTGEIQQKITDHKAGVISLSFSPDGTILATGAEDKTLRLHKLKSR